MFDRGGRWAFFTDAELKSLNQWATYLHDSRPVPSVNLWKEIKDEIQARKDDT